MFSVLSSQSYQHICHDLHDLIVEMIQAPHAHTLKHEGILLSNKLD